MAVITCRQLKAGRHLAGLSQAKLAELSGLSSNTVASAETRTGGRYVSITKIIAALESAGVKFQQDGVQIGATIITKGEVADA